MMKHLLPKLLMAGFFITSVSLSAQEIAIQSLRQNIDIFTGVLEDALGIAQSTGLFGMSIGGIDSTYLYGQGVVLEVRTSLANRRNRMSLSFLNASVLSLPSRPNPFTSLRPPGSPEFEEPIRNFANSSGIEAADFYADMLDRVANVDYSISINSAIRQAVESARSLRTMNSMDDTVYAEIQTEMASLRQELQGHTEELRQDTAEIRTTSDQADDTVASDIMFEMQARLDEFMARIEPLKQRAIAKAAELKAQSEEAEKEYVARWAADVSEFESNLYGAMCDYGSMLRELPPQESVAIILTGLGEDTEDGRHTDKVHVFNKTDLVQCQNGELDLAGLRQRSAQYSY
ncbi:MAG TPA: hypothetical protein EYG42_07415 [Porticoccaceae bacterium]|nr:hypothetical protein [Porticoccaceae bacterium]